MRILSYMVARNEADRYLDACLAWATFLDGIAFFDDNSTDDTVDIAAAHGVKVCSRGDSAPSFLSNESLFRQAAWEWFEDVCSPEDGDWVLALDADEFLVADEDVRSALELQIDRALRDGATSLRIHVPEVFAVSERDGYLVDPQVRVDGFWGNIRGTRLFRWRPDGQFSGRRMGCGAEPTYVPKSRICESTGLALMHYGYAWPEDRKIKHERYTKLLDHGHSDTHVQSIIKPPTLHPFSGAEPLVWRGVR